MGISASIWNYLNYPSAHARGPGTPKAGLGKWPQGRSLILTTTESTFTNKSLTLAGHLKDQFQTTLDPRLRIYLSGYLKAVWPGFWGSFPPTKNKIMWTALQVMPPAGKPGVRTGF